MPIFSGMVIRIALAAVKNCVPRMLIWSCNVPVFHNVGGLLV